jgi:hypothetical protein
VFTANACGMFADSCEDYGETAPGFGLFAAGTIVAAAIAAGGIVVTIAAAVARRRRTSPET